MYALGTVTASLAAAAGFAGWMYGGASISDSYANVNVTFNANSQWVTGGGAGFVAVFSPFGDPTSLNRVYAAGTVTLGVGGLTSFADLAAHIYAGTITDSFADENISSNGLFHTSAGTTPGSSVQTTTAMKTQATYTNWDFTTVWQINPAVNGGYPTLR